MSALGRSRGLLSGRRGVALVLVVLLVVAAVVALGQRDGGRRVTVYFPSAAALYVGNPVEVLGVPVGSVESITPQSGRVKVVLDLDDGVDLPADVSALQVSPSLISGRSITLAPAYSSGPRLGDDAVIPLERAEVPLDVNDLYTSAQDLSSTLGPTGANKNGALSRALDVLARNLDGNGDRLAAAIRGLADASGTLAGSRQDLAGTVRGLQTFVSTLSDNDGDVRALNTRLATVSSFLADDRTELGAALEELSVSLGQVATFVRDNRATLRTNVDRLSKVTQVLTRNRRLLGQILDEAPTGLGNLANAYDSAGSTLDVRIDVNELALAPGALICELLARSTPSQLPDVLTGLCGDLTSPLDGLGLPTPAQVAATLQHLFPSPNPGGAR